MKRHLMKFAVLLAALVIVFAGCRQNAVKDTVSPYPLTKDQKELLGYLNLENTAMLFTYHCPEEALEVTATSYVLENGAWSKTGEGTISWDAEDGNPREGVFTLVYGEDRSFDMSLSAQGTSSFTSKPVDDPGNLTAYSHAWLSQEQDIQLGEELPVAVFVADSGNQMASFETEDFFSPETLKDMDLVQAVTLNFTS